MIGWARSVNTEREGLPGIAVILWRLNIVVTWAVGMGSRARVSLSQWVLSDIPLLHGCSLIYLRMPLD